MQDFVKQLFENNVISEDMKSEIENAWESRIQENRDQVTSTLREEFAHKYEHDKSSLLEAVETMISDRLASEIADFAEDRQGLIEAKANYARKMKNDAIAMESFVLKNLSKELAELNEDRRAVADNVSKLESFIVDALAKEIAEFHTDKKDLAETKVRLVRESKAKFATVKNDFIAHSATIIESTVTKGLRAEMTQLKEDIESARRNDFGRRIFESFASEYAASHLNEKSETVKLMQIVKQKDLELAEAAKIVVHATQLAESKASQVRALKESTQRKDVLNELLSPLVGDKRSTMSELLESVQTDKLYSAYDKYLPAVLDRGVRTTRKSLTESTEVTGNKQAPAFIAKTAELTDIRRLAGLSA
jgi:hypothetical protein